MSEAVGWWSLPQVHQETSEESRREANQDGASQADSEEEWEGFWNIFTAFDADSRPQHMRGSCYAIVIMEAQEIPEGFRKANCADGFQQKKFDESAASE